MKWYEKLKARRIEMGLTLREVSALTEMSNPMINQIENGRVENPSFFKMSRLLELYHMTPEQLSSDE